MRQNNHAFPRAPREFEASVLAPWAPQPEPDAEVLALARKHEQLERQAIAADEAYFARLKEVQGLLPQLPTSLTVQCQKADGTIEVRPFREVDVARFFESPDRRAAKLAELRAFEAEKDAAHERLGLKALERDCEAATEASAEAFRTLVGAPVRTAAGILRRVELFVTFQGYDLDADDHAARMLTAIMAGLRGMAGETRSEH